MKSCAVALADVGKFMKYAIVAKMEKIADLAALVGTVNSRTDDLQRILDEARSRGLSPDPAALPLDMLIFLLVLDHSDAFTLLRRSLQDQDDGDLSATLINVLEAVRHTRTDPSE